MAPYIKGGNCFLYLDLLLFETNVLTEAQANVPSGRLVYGGWEYLTEITTPILRRFFALYLRKRPTLYVG